MDKSLERYFKSYRIRENDRDEFLVEYKIIKYELEEKRFDFYKLKNSEIRKIIFPFILAEKGYDFAARKVYDYLDRNTNDVYVKIERLLIDLGLILQPKIEELNPFLKHKVIIYRREEGISKKVRVKYLIDDYCYNIMKVHWDNTKYVKCKVLNNVSEKIIEISIEIPPYARNFKSFIETIMVYTDHDLKIIEFFIDNYDDKAILQEKNENDESFINRISKNNDIDKIINDVKIREIVTKREIDINYKIRLFRRCSEIDDYTIKMGLYCENFIKNHPIIIDDTLKYLNRMYSENILTEDSIKILEFLKFTSSGDSESRKAIFNIKLRWGIIDEDFIKELKYIYSLSTNHEKFDLIINKVICNSNTVYDIGLLKIVRDFYRRNGDLNSLIVLCRELTAMGENLRGFGIRLNDRIMLIYAYKRNKLLNLEETLEYVMDYYEKSDYIKGWVDSMKEESLFFDIK